MSKVHVRLLSVSKEITYQNSDFSKIEIQTMSVENNIPLKFEFSGERKKLAKDLLIGQEMIITYQIKGNRFEKKDAKGKPLGLDIINSLNGYKINIIPFN